MQERKTLAYLKDALLDLWTKIQRRNADAEKNAHTSTSSSSTRGENRLDPGIDSSREESRGSVANINSLLVSSKGSTISGEKRHKIFAFRVLTTDLRRKDAAIC